MVDGENAKLPIETDGHCELGKFRYLRPVSGGNTKAIYIPCGRCSICRVKAAKRRTAKVLDWLRALLDFNWGRGICLLVTCTLDPANGERRGKAGRERLQAGLTRLKTELRRQLPGGSRIVLSVRSYEKHKDGCLHAHLVVMISGPYFLVKKVALQDSFAEGFVAVSQRSLEEPDAASSAIRYAIKYVLKGELVVDRDLKGTRWYHIWSRYHRCAPRVSRYRVVHSQNPVTGRPQSLWNPRDLKFRYGSQLLSGRSVARLLFSLRTSLDYVVGTGWLISSPLPLASSNVLLR